MQYLCRLNAGKIALALVIVSVSVVSPAGADEGESSVFSLYDKDGDGFLNRDEFAELAKTRRNREGFTFEKVDKNKDDKVSGKELVNALQAQLRTRNGADSTAK